MISPFKAVIGDCYKAVEARLLAAIHLRFGLPAVPAESLRNLIKSGRPQRGLLRSHPARRLRNQPRRANSSAPPKPLSPALERDYLTPWPAETAEKRFRERFEIPCESLTGHGNDHPLQYDYAMIHVCSLARLHETVETSARATSSRS